MKPTAAIPQQIRTRLLSLDVFRGLTVMAMILVNNPGDWDHVYWPLDHSVWHGCTPTDLVMPFFLFIVGVAIPFSLGKLRDQHAPWLGKVARRTVILFALGMLLAYFPASNSAVDQVMHHPLQRLATLRIMGVLQRIAVVYAICAIVFMITPPRAWLWICVALLIGYWGLIALVPVPDAAGIWHSPSLNDWSNVTAFVDQKVLGISHLYKGGPGDPEGLLSTLSAVATGLIGMRVGQYLKQPSDKPARRCAWLFCAGVGLAALGWTWGLFYPLNKQLWTGSYTLTTGGLAILLLTTFHWIIDVNRFNTGWTVPIAFGTNAIAAFVGSGLLARVLMWGSLAWCGERHGFKTYAYHRWLEPLFSSPDLASFSAAVLYLGLFSLIVLELHRRRWIIKV